ncbi:MAG TPA: 4-phosphoerythronate dehydrogenase [Candidatus Brocadiia bacterium]|nr:4-phosphoerythronate dehydrogenase [Candidatus Brocadiia bacterium]
MKIIADENIPFARDSFSTIGEVVTMPGRAMTAESIAGAELLMVRSVTKVNEKLLVGTRVCFVATATIGTDHMDTDWLDRAKIAWAAAPGSNANSVSEYITAALLVVSGRMGISLAGKKIGVVGVGNVGSRVVRKCEALGMTPMRNDPPLAEKTGDAKYRPIEEILEQADVITLHTPLTREGRHATHHLADGDFISRMKPGAILFNSSRGPVVEPSALRVALKSGRLAAAVLDVWENEPAISRELLGEVAIGTPHIAGYSFDGKVNGTQMIYEAACAFLGVKPTWRPGNDLPPPANPQIAVLSAIRSEEDELRRIVIGAYDILADDAALRGVLKVSEGEVGPYFDKLRKQYPIRREFQNVTITGAPAGSSLAAKLSGLGFRTA